MILAILYGLLFILVTYQLIKVKQNEYTKVLANFMIIVITVYTLCLINAWIEQATLLALGALSVIILIIVYFLSISTMKASNVIKADLDIRRKLAHMIVLLVFVKPLIEYINNLVCPGLVSLLGEPPSGLQIEASYPVYLLEMFFLSLPLIVGLVEFLRIKLGLVRLPGLRRKEINDLATYFYTCLSATFVFLLFKLEIALAAIAASIIGDSMGCIVGKTIGKTKIKDKTLEGTIAEFVTASLVAYPFIGFFGLIGAALIAIFDVLSPPLDDNLYFPPLFAISVMWFF